MLRARIAAAGLLAALTAAAPAAAQTDETAAGAAETSDPFVESCMEDLRQLSDELGREGRTLGGRHMRSLFDAASVFANNGMEEACRATIEGIRTYAEKLRDERGGAQDAAAPGGYLENAQPISGDVTAAGRFMDDIVLSAEGDRLGTVDDVISRQGTQYLLVGGDGFLDLDETYRPIELDRFRRLDPDTLVLPMDERAFEQAPSYELGALDLGEWASDVEVWWDANVETE
jgi:hypothetical protein